MAIRSVSLLLAALGCAGRLQGQALRRDTLHVVLVGRNESADVWIDRPVSDSGRAPLLSAASVPVDPAGPVVVRTLIPVLIGGVQLAPGRYRVMVASAPDTAVVMVPEPSIDSRSIAAGRSVAARLEPWDGAPPPPGTAVTIVVRRRGADTLVVDDMSTRRMAITKTTIHPGSAATLVIRVALLLLAAPISAR